MAPIIKEKSFLVGGHRIIVAYKAVKNLYLKVNPDNTIVATAPAAMKDEEIIHFLEERLEWIEKGLAQNSKMAGAALSKEGLLLWGKRRQIELIKGKQYPVLTEEKITVGVPSLDIPMEKLAESIFRWQLSQEIAKLVYKWEQKLNLPLGNITIRKMSSRWGSCNRGRQSFSLNLYLACCPKECLEMVFVHELVHIYEAGHGKEFYALMDKMLPDWRERDAVLRKYISVIA